MYKDPAKMTGQISHDDQPFNAGINSICATLPAEIFYWGFGDFNF
jgi:hypothetical protein